MSYSGDGNLSTNIGSISGTTLSVTDEDGSFNGIVTATAGTSFAATTLNFSYTEAGGGGSSAQQTATFALECDGETVTSETNIDVDVSAGMPPIQFTTNSDGRLVIAPTTVYHNITNGDLYLHFNDEFPRDTPTNVSIHIAETTGFTQSPTITFKVTLIET